MAAGGISSQGDDLAGLFDASPDPRVHTSAAAELGFLLGLFAALAAPFSVMHALALAASILGIAFGFVGLATTSRPNVAGGALTPLALLLAFTAVIVVGLRYFGVDTAFGDELLPTLGDWLQRLNAPFLPA
ncbi:nitric oxide reductase large subunit [Nocardioides thalensis]|uniref:Nitric oxide reductase large subunit n=1 Tax=Nocardioides thalensis TaxID=1914755 RepID=A0A853C2Y5_9ACTN|nr:hypothetical protein [Nocardioides thalensis]NYJ00948.1 nitric oxide reductase large subunit [Nocardioides thalensis]